ncbi:ribonuclease H-like domain-containing protein [Tanacetum coccineum]|uniref:Ribonuclease H-like domain-containing protein n=1 Tax=Tanacetum coccineum TaxID=301880 RepID=A0ABQ4WUW4_9ASTR
MNEKGVDSSKDELIKEESKAEVQEESKEEESKKKRKLGTRKKMKSRKRRYIQNTSEDDSDKENDELRLVSKELKPQPIKAEHLKEINLNVVNRRFQDEIPEGFDRVLWGDLMVMFNPDDENEFWNAQQDWKIVSWKLHSSSGVHTIVTETELVIHMLVEKKYPLRKEVLMQMLKLKLESEEENTMALELIKFVKKILAELESEEHKNWLVHKQTACGKDFSNPFMVDNLPKIVRFSTHLASVVKSWLVHDQTVHALASPKANELTIPEQTATGKGTSNPLMAAALNWIMRTWKQIDEYDLERNGLKVAMATLTMIMKMFYKKTGRKLQFDAKEAVGFDKTKVECYNCHKTSHFARECRFKRTQDNRRRDAWNSGNKDGSRTGQNEDILRHCDSVDEKVWIGNQIIQKMEDYALDAFNTQTQTQSEINTCEPVVNESIVESQPKVWSDAPIIKEYESDSEDECVSIPTKQQETPSFANQQVKTPRENVKCQNTHSQKPKVDKKDLGHGFAVRACFVCGSLNHLIRDCDFHEKRMARKADLNNGWNNVKRVNKQNQFVPSAVLTRTGIIPVNTARTSGTKNFSTVRQSVNRKTVLTSTAMKVNTVKPIVNRVRPTNVFQKTHSPTTRPFKKTTVLRPNVSNQKFNTAKVNAVSTVEGKRETADYPHRALKNKGIVDSGCSRHMTGNKAYLAEFQGFNGWPIDFWRSKAIKFVLENQANIHASQQEANQNAGTEETIDVGDSDKEDDSAQDCFVLPIWPSYSSTNTPAEAEAHMKKFETCGIKEGAAKPSSTNIFSTVSTPTKASSTNPLNTDSIPVSTASPYEGLSLDDPTHSKEDDLEIPSHLRILTNSTDCIFTTSSFDDRRVQWLDFTNLKGNCCECLVLFPHQGILPYPEHLILGDPNLAVQTRSNS